MVPSNDAGTLRALTRRFPRAGRLELIALRPARRVPAVSVATAVALAGRGLEGDRRTGSGGRGRGTGTAA